MLAALLLSGGTAVTHEWLLDAVWGAQPPPVGRKVLPTHINSLRRVLDPEGTPPSESVIRSGKGWYRFVIEHARLDTDDVDELGDAALSTVASGDPTVAADELASVLALFRGEPLAGLPGPFARDERQRLQERRRTLRLERLRCLVVLRRFGEALDDLGGLPESSEAEHYDESLRALRIRVLYGCGRQAEALAAFEDMRVRLRDELGADPGEELRRVHEAVLHQDSAFLLPPQPKHTGPRVPAELPHDVGDFAGRAEALGQLGALLPALKDHGGPSGTVVISAIGGAAGIGKTALAVHWAHLVRDRFPDGQLCVNLHGFDHDRLPLEPGEALEQLLRGLGLTASEIPPDLEAQSRILRSLSAGRRLLVLLDNAASADQVRPLLPAGPNCCVVVTSRNRLGDLVARDGAHALSLDILRLDEARALLSRVLGAERVDDDRHAVDELVRLCGGLPLALRVAAARLAGDPALRTADLVAELTEGSKLEALAPDADSDSPLRTAFSVSYGVLSPAARRMFRLLGLFPGADFTAAAAAALSSIPLTQARRLLGTLASAHLIEPSGVGRYRFHDLLREYAHDRALAEEPAAERGAAVDRLLLWYLHAVRATAGTGLFPDLPSDLGLVGHPGMPSITGAEQWLEAEGSNLLAVIGHADRHGPRSVTWYLVSTLFTHFWTHLPRRTWQAVAQTALDAAESEKDLFGQSAMHSSLAAARWDRGHVRQAMVHATQALEISRRAGWAAGEASALGLRGFAEWSTAELGLALHDFEAGLRFFRETGTRQFEGFGLTGLGMTCRDLGRLDEAAGHLERAVALGPEGSAWNSRSTVQILGGVYWELGRFADGLALLGPAMESDGRTGQRDGHAMMLDAVARIRLDLGDHEQALEQAELALTMVEDTKRFWVQAGILNTVAAAHRRLAHPERALRADEQALALARAAMFRRAEADTLLSLSLSQFRLGRSNEARDHAGEALRLARTHSFRATEGRVMTALFETVHTTDVGLAQDALAIHRETGHRLGEARTLQALARAHRVTDRATASLMDRQAAEVLTAIGVPEEKHKDLDR
ncbi:BTAD domain-containing putative transcriptional regulator [Streptomyces sp. NBC_01185]|uniref:AfsR/SARP family transcriptional regulator n=1 Tax=Streptomyces sp. NBC_01185 TaxID=2903764 RepID=UPI0038658207|nr:NB-ARC domain-containing protein [Streptomyces sp. NBC_01185]